MDDFVSKHALEILIEKVLQSQPSGGMRAILWDIFVEMDFQNLSEKQLIMMLKDVARHNEERTLHGAKIVAEIKRRGLYVRLAEEPLNNIQEELQNLSKLSPGEYHKLLKELLNMPMEHQNHLEAYPNDFGIGLELEMKLNEPHKLYKMIDLFNNFFQKNNLENWLAKSADGDNQIEIVTPFYVNTEAQGQQLTQEMSVVMNSELFQEHIKSIQSMHYNVPIAPVNDEQKRGGFLRLIKTLEAVLFRISGNTKHELTDEDFGSYTSLLDIDVLFRDYRGEDRSVYNLRDSKTENRMTLPAVIIKGAKHIDPILLQSNVNVMFALLKYASQNPEKLNMLYLPVPKLLGSPKKDTVTEEQNLQKILDEIYQDDVMGKIRFLKLFYRPGRGTWKKYAPGENSKEDVREEYYRAHNILSGLGYAGAYRMHEQYSQGYNRDVLGFIKENLPYVHDKEALEAMDDTVLDVLVLMEAIGTFDDRTALLELIQERGFLLNKEDNMSEFLNLRGSVQGKVSLMDWIDTPGAIQLIGRRLTENEKKDAPSIIKAVADKKIVWRNLTGLLKQTDEEIIDILIEANEHNPQNLLSLLNMALSEENQRRVIVHILKGKDVEVVKFLLGIFNQIQDKKIKLEILEIIKSSEEDLEEEVVEGLELIAFALDEDVGAIAFDILTSRDKVEIDLIVKLANGPHKNKLKEKAIEVLIERPEAKYRKDGALNAIDDHSNLEVKKRAVAMIFSEFPEEEDNFWEKFNNHINQEFQIAVLSVVIEIQGLNTQKLVDRFKDIILRLSMNEKVQTKALQYLIRHKKVDGRFLRILIEKNNQNDVTDMAIEQLMTSSLTRA